MNIIVKASLILLMAATAGNGFAQQPTTGKAAKKLANKASRKPMAKKKRGIEEKIAVSDQAKPSDLKKGKTTNASAPKAQSGISNK